MTRPDKKDFIMASQFLKIAALPFLCAATLTACSASKATQKNTAAVQSEPAVQTIKIGAHISFEHDFDGALKSGEIETVNLSIRDRYAAGILTVDILNNENLSVLSSQPSYSFDMSGDAPHEIDFNVQALTDGLHYLNFKARAELPDGQVLPASFSIKVSSGIANQKTRIAAPIDSDNAPAPSGGVIVMDAEEEIK